MSSAVITKQFGREVVPKSVRSVRCPDGRQRNAFVQGFVRWASDVTSLPCRINVRHKSVMGVCELQDGDTWVFVPRPDTANLHMLNPNHVWGEEEVGVIFPAEQSYTNGKRICMLAIDNGWDYAGDGICIDDMEPASRYYGDAWVYAEDYMNARCTLKGYEFRTDKAGNWGYWRKEC